MAEVKELQCELKETDDILNILDNKIHVIVSDIGFRINRFDDVDNELSDSKNKKGISEMGIFLFIK